MTAMFVNGSRRNEQSLLRPSINACYQVLVHFAKRFRGEDFLDIDQPEKRIANAAIFFNGSERNNQS
jgi:hypothetical protein